MSRWIGYMCNLETAGKVTHRVDRQAAYFLANLCREQSGT